MKKKDKRKIHSHFGHYETIGMIKLYNFKGNPIMIDTNELNHVIEKLEAKGTINAVNIQKLWTTSHLIHNATEEDLPSKLEKLQQMNNLLYEKYPSEELLIDLQVFINSLRNEYDITDPREVIHTDNGRGFVQ